MTCSYAISIMLFLSFHVMVVFLNESMPALKPAAPDVSITMGIAVLDRSLAERIQNIPGVKNVYVDNGEPVYTEQTSADISGYADYTSIDIQLEKKMLTATLSLPYAACFLRAAAFPINVCPTRKHRVLFTSAQSLSVDF